MAISANVVWEVRTTGSDTNGCGFNSAAAGTDRSQQTSAQVNIDNSTITTSITTAVITFTGGYTATSADVGNVVHMATGTNVTVGFYEITGQTSSTWTVDRNVVTSGTTTNATGKMGGCSATIGNLSGVMVASNKMWIKNGTYSENSLTFSAGVVTPSGTVAPTWISGYDATRGDLYPGSANVANRPVFNYGAAGTAWTFTNTWWIENVQVKANSGTFPTCINANNLSIVQNCLLRDYTTTAFFNSAGNRPTLSYCEITAGNGASGKALSGGTNALVINNYIHDITGGGSSTVVAITGNGVIIGNIMDTISGAGSHGVANSQGGLTLLDNTFYSLGGDGTRLNTTMHSTLIKGNIFDTNTGFGLNQNTSAWPSAYRWDGNAYYNNTAGAKQNLTSTSGNYNSAPYVNTLDQTLSGDPFTSASGADFTLNNTAGAGAACRGTGYPPTFPTLTTVAVPDMGPVQHQSASTPASIVYVLVE